MIRNTISLLLVFFLISSCAKNEDTQKAPSNSRGTDIDNPFNNENPIECLAVDTDGDGLLDCVDPDIDGDGVLNEVDAFPYDKYEWLDSDGDGVGDNADWAPLDPREWMDTDGDNIGDNADADDDNDGVPDVFEYIGFSKDDSGWADVDFDGLADWTIDEDNDNDGVPNLWDDLFWDKNGWFDIDEDLIPNHADLDMDGDGIPNLIDAFPWDPTEWFDDDLDGLGNNTDPDDDNDGFPDSWEEFPRNRLALFDTDGDGYSNEEDAFPFDPTEWLDSDGDGVGDNSDPFPLNPNEWMDADGDGIGDNSDNDIDNDGFINCVPIINPTLDPTYPECNQDSFPYDRFEWLDTDGDGVGDNADADDDNDGIPDIFDNDPKDNKYFADYDKDRVPDVLIMYTQEEKDFFGVQEHQVFFRLDPDMDNDGVPNLWDDLNTNSFEYFDIDGDGIGHKTDLDLDGDGVVNSLDRFPWDPDEWADFDNDLIGDNADADDDNDGVPDLFDSLPKNIYGFSDMNNDNFADSVSTDLDGDGYSNGTFSCTSQFGVWNESIDINNDDILDAVCFVGNEDNRSIRLHGNLENPAFISCVEDANSYEEQQMCFTERITSSLPYGECVQTNAPSCIDNDLGIINHSCVETNAPSCSTILNTARNSCISFEVKICEYEAYSTNGSTGRNDLFPWDPNEWEDKDGDGLPDNLIDEDSDNDGVPDLWDDFPADNIANQRWRWFDADKDGLANMIYYFDISSGIFKYEYGSNGVSGLIADSDSDNDGYDHGILTCVRVSDNLITGPDHYQFEPDFEDCLNPNEYYDEETDQCLVNPDVIMVNGTQDTINCFYEKTEGLDFFPFDPNENSDVDGDRIGDLSDEDIDGDWQNNCVESNWGTSGVPYRERFDIENSQYAGDPSNTLTVIGAFVSKRIGDDVYRFEKRDCDLDELPFVSRTDDFNTAVFQPKDSPPGYDTVSYCAAPDCYYKNYDRDGDGLTDYEEYILGSNPIVADTDGDLVLDIYERLEKTDPNDELSYLDDDGDGIPNSIDPFPQGAFDQGSLLNQVTSSGNCSSRSESACEALSGNKLSFCSLVDDLDNIQMDEDNNPVFAKKCVSQPVLITKDITLNDCVNVSGQVILQGKNGSKITANEFNSAIRCSQDRVLFNALTNSELTLNNIILEVGNVSAVIGSVGKSVSLIDSSITGNSTDMITALNYNNPTGTVSIYNSTLRSVLNRNTRPTKDIQEPLMNINSNNLIVQSSLMDCNYVNYGIEEKSNGSGTYFLDDFSCIISQSTNTEFTKNIVSLMGDDIDTNNLVSNAKAMVHNSVVQTNFFDINTVKSGMNGLFLSGLGLNIDPDNLYIKDNTDRENDNEPVGVYFDDSTEVVVKESSIDYTKMFSNEKEGVLYCKNDPLDVLQTYFSPVPQNELLSQLFVESFVSSSINKIGSNSYFTDSNIVNDFWNTDNIYSLPLTAYDEDNERILLSAVAGLPEGISAKIEGLTVGKKYKIIIGVNALSPAKPEINLNLQLSDVNDVSKIYETVRIVLLEDSSQNKIDYDPLNLRYIYRSIYVNDNIEFVFRAKDTEFYLRLNNTMPSEHVYINKVELIESTGYETQILGAPLPVCKEDEKHLIK